MSEFACIELMGAAREARRRRQEDLLKRFPGTLVSFSMNIAGPVKRPRFSCAAMDAGEDALFEELPEGVLLHREEITGIAGHERFYCLAMDAMAVKRAACRVEDTHPLGRLFDLDVLKENGEKLSRSDLGLGERRCLLCENPASVCARSRRHSVEELTRETERMLSAYFSQKAAAWLADEADEALRFEVSVTPKPGLVDRNNNGSHRDMTYLHFERSREAIFPYWAQFAKIGWEQGDAPETLLASLRPIGLSAEQAMFRATGGINTHKGAIFSLGVLVAAAAKLMAEDRDFSVEELLSFAGRIASPAVTELSAQKEPSTHGECAYRRFGCMGARGEAANGFPHAKLALEQLFLWQEKGLSENDAGAVALLSLIADLSDTNMIARVGEEKASALQKEAKALLKLPEKEIIQELTAFDERMISLNASPGGCADMLAAGRFLKAVFEP